jgi:C-terminal processing protease CtpA/Prc
MSSSLFAQSKFDGSQRDRARAIARDIAENLRKNYYDPAFHGQDLNALFKAADQHIQEAVNLGQAFGSIATALDAFNDSHTFFDPPPRPIRRELGFETRIIGENCFVIAVRPGSDAAEKLAPGDQVLDIEGLRVARQNLWKVSYAVNRLYALPVVHMNIRRPDGSERKVEVSARITPEKRVLDITKGDDIWQLIRQDENEERVNRQRFVSSDSVMIWKMPQFDLDDEGVDKVIRDARRHGVLIVDLRGNPGGLVKTLQAVVSGVMDHEVTIAERTGRKPALKPITAKSRGSQAFTGKLIMLIDGRSASAAELFARVVQLEHRGIVLGDRSSGSVMEARYYPLSLGSDTKIFYGASITDADLIMADGKSLEHAGVTPDEVVLPTAQDLAAGRDPVLARAAAIAGVALDPAAAGKMFPIEWQAH